MRCSPSSRRRRRTRSARRRCSPARSRAGCSSCSSGSGGRGGCSRSARSAATRRSRWRRRCPRTATSTLRARSGARGVRAALLRPLAARREDHAPRRPGAGDDRPARRRVRLRLHRRRQGWLRRLLRGGRAAPLRTRPDRRRQHACRAGASSTETARSSSSTSTSRADPRTVQVILSVRDGLTLIRRA